MDKDKLIKVLGEALLKAPHRFMPPKFTKAANEALAAYEIYCSDRTAELIKTSINTAPVPRDEYANTRTENHQQSYPHRLFVFSKDLDQAYSEGARPDPPCPAEKANLIISTTKDGYHAPALDIDFPARLVPSKTNGHFHLFLERKMTWDKYKELLLALAKADVIEDGYAKASIARGYSSLRWQWGMAQPEWSLMRKELEELKRDLDNEQL